MEQDPAIPFAADHRTLSKNRTRLSTKALLTRWFARDPIGLHRAGLGCVFGSRLSALGSRLSALGSRLLMLEHKGRTSGARCFVVLEVVDHPAPGQYVVISGFGTKAQWYRNIQVDS